METLAGKTASEISDYFASVGEYKEEQPHALCVSYFESVASSEVVKIDLLRSILNRLEELAGKDFVKTMSSTREDLLINALLQDFGFIEELEFRGGIKLRITDVGLYNMEPIRAYIKKYYHRQYESRKRKRSGKEESAAVSLPLKPTRTSPVEEARTRVA